MYARARVCKALECLCVRVYAPMREYLCVWACALDLVVLCVSVCAFEMGMCVSVCVH